jgi:hypothetical protein
MPLCLKTVRIDTQGVPLIVRVLLEGRSKIWVTTGLLSMSLILSLQPLSADGALMGAYP